MAANLGQLEMLPANEPIKLSDEAQEEIARQCHDGHDAMVQCFRHSGLDPKQVYGPLKMSQTQFSLFLSRKAYIPHERRLQFMAICGNLIPFRYEAWKLDFEIRRIRSGLEAENDRLKAENADKERVIQYLLGARRP